MGKIEKFIEKSNIKYQNKYDYSKAVYVGVQKPLEIVCPEHGSFWQTPDVHIHSKYGCPKCAMSKHIEHTTGTIEDFIAKARKIHGDRYDYSKTVYRGTREKLIITCPVHGDFEQLPWSHVGMRCGCPRCSSRALMGCNEFIRRALEIHGDRYDYSKVVYKGLHRHITITCKIHGDFEVSPANHLWDRGGCPICKSSKGELSIKRYLENSNIPFVQNKRFGDCRNKNPLPFDFYLPDYDICIEYDGEQHFTPIRKWGGQKNFENIQKRDQIKNKYCKDNNIKLIRISYKQIDDVENILEKELNI